MNNLTKLLVITGALLLGACASHPEQKKVPWENYAAKKSVDVFNPDFSNFRIISNNQVVIWESPRNAYLVSVLGPCFFDDTAPVLGFTTKMGDMVSAATDSILYLHQRCPIQRIQKLDLKKLKTDGYLK
ncbi:DUF6491 family protein [Gallaecimonas mangrovi]|uniref:DUF6491 family protein n=1 Tax=Gallaecimonas mangrovi TaxID=2291597 RepID=UPI000E1FED40|nr:DUF6491 family protein [Gallaecimonas mangrovi]